VQPSVTTTESFLPEDDPAGSKHVGVCYNLRKKLFVHSLVFKVFFALKWIFKKWDGGAWTGLNWLRIGTDGGLL
jgi:hypothetical protein